MNSVENYLSARQAALFPCFTLFLRATKRLLADIWQLPRGSKPPLPAAGALISMLHFSTYQVCGCSTDTNFGLKILISKSLHGKCSVVKSFGIHTYSQNCHIAANKCVEIDISFSMPEPSNPTVAAFHVAVYVKILSFWVIAYHMYMPTYLHAVNYFPLNTFSIYLNPPKPFSSIKESTFALAGMLSTYGLPSNT